MDGIVYDVFGFKRWPTLKHKHHSTMAMAIVIAIARVLTVL